MNPNQIHTLHLQSPLGLTFSCPWTGEDVVDPSLSTRIWYFVEQCQGTAAPGKAVTRQSIPGGQRGDVFAAVQPLGAAVARGAVPCLTRFRERGAAAKPCLPPCVA